MLIFELWAHAKFKLLETYTIWYLIHYEDAGFIIVNYKKTKKSSMWCAFLLPSSTFDPHAIIMCTVI